MPGCLRKLMRWDSAMLLSNPYAFPVARRDAKVGSVPGDFSELKSSVLSKPVLKQSALTPTGLKKKKSLSPYSVLSRQSVSLLAKSCTKS